MKSIIAAIAFVLSVGLIATVASAHRSGYSGHHMDYGHGYCWTDSDEANETSAAWDKFNKETTELRKEMVKKGAELDALYAAENPDTEAIKKLRVELLDLRVELDKKAVEAGVGYRGWGRGGYSPGGCF